MILNVRHFLAPRSARPRRRRRSAVLRQGGVAVVRASPTRLQLRGELDLAGASLVAELLADRTIEELDVAGVSFVDAAGLAPLVAACGGTPGRQLRLLTPSTAMTRILDLAGEVGTFAVWP